MGHRAGHKSNEALSRAPRRRAGSSSILIAGIHAIELSKKSRPHEGTAQTPSHLSGCGLDTLKNRRGYPDQFFAPMLGANLNRARGFEQIHMKKGIGRRRTDCEKTVIPQQKKGFVAEIPD
jgi:hypothetical protein